MRGCFFLQSNLKKGKNLKFLRENRNGEKIARGRGNRSRGKTDEKICTKISQVKTNFDCLKRLKQILIASVNFDLLFQA